MRQVDKHRHIADRTLDYALAITRLYRELQEDPVGRILGKTLLRSGTSVGANVQEAQAAQSKADFIAKISIAHKEARETDYWIRLLREGHVLPEETFNCIADETTQINRILAASIITVKRNSKARSSGCSAAALNSSL